MDLIPPWTTRSDFQVLDQISHGHFGKVWKARHLIGQKCYAIKQVFIDKTLRYYKGDSNKLYREVTVLQDLEHQNIIRYHYSWLEGETPEIERQIINCEFIPKPRDSSQDSPVEKNFLFIQMELCDLTLEDWRKNNSTVDALVSEFPRLVVQIAEGLKYIHGKNIVHRDLKPNNIFRKGEVWKIGDFGLAKANPDTENVVPSQAGSSKYKSPEKQNTVKSDVYTFALIIVEYMHPKFEFYLYEEEEKWDNSKHWLNTLRTWFLPEFRDTCELIYRMLSPDVSERPDSNYVLKELKKIPSLGSYTSVGIETETPTTGIFGVMDQTNILQYQKIDNQQNTLIQALPKQYYFQRRQTSKNFVPRKQPLKYLQTAFEEQRFLVSLIGLGGVGKSEIAKYFAQQFYAKQRGNCIWMECQSVSSLTQSIQNLASELRVKEKVIHDLTNLSFVFHTALKELSGLPTLIIMDNLDEVHDKAEEILREFRNYPAKSEIPFIVITSRNREVINLGGEFLELKVFEDDEAFKLVVSSLGNSPKLEVKSLCKTLQNFPLALQQAVAYIQQQTKTKRLKPFGITEYLTLFENQKKKILGHKLPLLDHDYTLTTLTAWNLNFESIKSNKELGTIAEELLHMWAFVFNADGEELKPLIELFETINIENKTGQTKDDDLSVAATVSNNYNGIPIVGGHNLWKPRNGERKEGLDTEEEVDIDDDDRLPAQAIQLIRSFSIFSIEIKYVDTLDCQIVTMHRLVQQVIRVNMGIEEEKQWLEQFGLKLQSLKFRKWSVVDVSKFLQRERLTENLWEHVLKHKQVIVQLKETFLHLWEDTTLPYCPEFDHNFYAKLYKTFSELNLNDSIAGMVAEKYYWQSKLQNQLDKYFASHRVSIENKWHIHSQKALDFAQWELYELLKRELKQLPQDNLLVLETLGIIINYLTNDMQPNYGIDVANSISNLKSVIIILLQRYLSAQPTGDVPPDQRFVLMCIISQIFQLLDTNADSSAFWIDLAAEFKKAQIHTSSLIYLFTYVHYIITASQHLQYFLEFLAHLSLRVEDIKTTPQIAQVSSAILNSCNYYSFQFVPVSIPSKLLKDIICYPESCCFSVSAIHDAFEALIKNRMFGEVKVNCIQFLQIAVKFCTRQKFQTAWIILIAVKYVEENLWNNKQFDDCIQICKSLPAVLNYRNYLEEPNLVIEWMENLVFRVKQTGLSGLLKLAIDSLETTMNAERDCVLRSLDLPPQEAMQTFAHENTNEVHEDSIAVQPIPIQNVFQAISKLYYDEGKYEEWQQRIIAYIQEQTAIGLGGYAESKMASAIANQMQSIKADQNISIPVSTWGFLFVVEHHGSLEEKNKYFFKTLHAITNAIQEQKNYATALEFGQSLANIGSKILDYQTNNPEQKTNFNKVRLSNLWYTILGIGEVSISLKSAGLLNQEQDTNLYCTLLNLPPDTSRTKAFETILSKIQSLIGYVEKTAYPILIEILGNFLVQYEQNQFNEFIVLGSIFIVIKKVISECLRFMYFKNVVRLCEKLSNLKQQSVFSKNSVVLSETSKRFSIKSISRGFEHYMLADRLSFLKAAKKYGKYTETHQVVHYELKIILENLTDEYSTSDFFLSRAESVFSFYLKYFHFLICEVKENNTSDDQTPEILHDVIPEEHQQNFQNHLETNMPCEDDEVATASNIFADDQKHHSIEEEVEFSDEEITEEEIEDPKTEILENLENVHYKIVDRYFSEGEFHFVYQYGLRLSFIPKRKIVLQEMLLRAFDIIIDELRYACEKYIDRVRRVFETQCRCECSDENNRTEFITRIDALFEEFGVKFKDGIEEDPEHSDYLETSEDSEFESENKITEKDSNSNTDLLELD